MVKYYASTDITTAVAVIYSDENCQNGKRVDSFGHLIGGDFAKLIGKDQFRPEISTRVVADQRLFTRVLSVGANSFCQVTVDFLPELNGSYEIFFFRSYDYKERNEKCGAEVMRIMQDGSKRAEETAQKSIKQCS